MIEKYGLFDSLESDERVYTEADVAWLVKALGKDGVHGSSREELKVVPRASGLGVNVNAGMAIVQGRYYVLEDDGSGVKSLMMATAVTNPRIDRIVLCLNYSARTISLSVLTGTEDVSPMPPAIRRNTAQYMISLAQVRIGVGAALIAKEDIIDERANEVLCGLHTDSAQTAMKKALEAGGTANAASAAAAEAKQAAQAAQRTADMGVSCAQSALEEAQKRIPQVSSAKKGTLAVFDTGGNLAGSGVGLSDFTRAKMTLSGTTLTITTVA